MCFSYDTVVAYHVALVWGLESTAKDCNLGNLKARLCAGLVARLHILGGARVLSLLCPTLLLRERHGTELERVFHSTGGSEVGGECDGGVPRLPASVIWHYIQYTFCMYTPERA
jgi:hypothetical protein